MKMQAVHDVMSCPAGQPVPSIAHVKHASGSEGHVLLDVQSPAQFVEFSPPAISQVPSPHTGPVTGQSSSQFAFVSPPSHVPLPHTGPAPQSCEQLPTSEAAHTPSPQTGLAVTAASTDGSSSPSPGLPAPQLHAANNAHTNASVMVLIAGHPTETKYEINDKLRVARRSATLGAVHILCKSAVERASQRGMFRSDQVRIFDEDRVGLTPGLEQQLGMLM